MAALFTAMLLSLANIPLTAGFVGKFYVLAAGAGSGLWWLLVIMVVNSAIGLFYYLRVVVVMYGATAAEVDSSPIKPSLALAGSVALAALSLLLVWLGVYPAPLIRIIQTTVAAAV